MAELDQANVNRLLAAVDNPDARNDTAAQLSKVAAKAEGARAATMPCSPCCPCSPSPRPRRAGRSLLPEHRTLWRHLPPRGRPRFATGCRSHALTPWRPPASPDDRTPPDA